MIALLQKDCIMIWKTSKSLLGVVLLFALIGGYDIKMLAFMVYAPIVLTSMSVNTMSYDEQSKWSLYAKTMPYDRRAMVGSKFVFSAVGCLLGVLLSLGSAIGFGLARGAVPVGELGVILCGALVAGTLNTVLMLPVAFWLGPTKGRLVFVVCLAVVFGAAANVSIPGMLLEMDMWLAAALLVLVCLVLWLISYVISVRLYQQRELK